MSGSRFELDPDAPMPGEPADAPSPVRRSRRGRAAEAAPTREGTTPSWPVRLATPLVSSAGHYLIGLLGLGAIVATLFNPTFGVLAPHWPHELFGAGGLSFAWNPPTVTAVALAVVLLGYLVALLLRAGRGRGTLVAAVTLVAFVTFLPETGLAAYLLPVALALVAGALVAQPNPGVEVGRKTVLLVGLSLLAVHLFVPWSVDRVEQAGRSGYYATALATVDDYVKPPAEGSAEPDRVAGLVPSTGACLLGLIGLLALVGLGGRWGRWAAGSVLVAAVLMGGLAWFLHGRGLAAPGGLPSWQAGLQELARRAHGSMWAYALPFAGAVADLIRGRRT